VTAGIILGSRYQAIDKIQGNDSAAGSGSLLSGLKTVFRLL
jgi:hypothetical protein